MKGTTASECMRRDMIPKSCSHSTKSSSAGAAIGTPVYPLLLMLQWKHLYIHYSSCYNGNTCIYTTLHATMEAPVHTLLFRLQWKHLYIHYSSCYNGNSCIYTNTLAPHTRVYVYINPYICTYIHIYVYVYVYI